MFAFWARVIARYPRHVLTVSVLVFLAGLAILATISPSLESNGFTSEQSESMLADKHLAKEYGVSADAIVVLVEADNSTSLVQSLPQVAAPLTNHPDLGQVAMPTSAEPSPLLSADGASAIIVAPLHGQDELPDDVLESIRTDVTRAADQHGLEVSFGGGPYTALDISSAVANGVIRAEIVAIPLTLIVLLLVFGSLVSASVPLIIGAASILLGMAAMTIWSTQGYQSIFAANMITMLGLGLGIDYSLFFVTRFREELKGHAPAEAMQRTMTTVGKAIFFSGVTVIIGLYATSFFDMPVLQSLGQAGMVVTVCALIFGFTMLPAILTLLGHRINAVTIARRASTEGDGESPFWHRTAESVMRRPVMVLIGTLVLLAALTIPAARISLDPGGTWVLPVSTESRVVADTLETDFPLAAAEPITVILNSTDTDHAADVQQRIMVLPGVNAVNVQHGERSTLLRVVAEDDERTVNSIRAMNMDALVGGMVARSVDTSNAIRDGIVPAVAFIAVAGYITLFLTFGSLILPLKAMFMSALSVAASVGVVTWVFQDGHLQELLNFSSGGLTVAIVPILIACVLFGLSMDYEVLLLSRMQEHYQQTGDNRASVAVGLSHTGQVVTGAAAIMVIVFAGFVLADVLVIKSLGFGLAFAVLLDATVVRGLLVPATMRLMGRWNWWAPAPLQALVHRLGTSHTNPPMPQGLEPVPVPARHD